MPKKKTITPSNATPPPAFITDYYSTSGLKKIPKRAEVLKNEELFQIYKKPKKDKRAEIAHMNDIGTEGCITG